MQHMDALPAEYLASFYVSVYKLNHVPSRNVVCRCLASNASYVISFDDAQMAQNMAWGASSLALEAAQRLRVRGVSQARKGFPPSEVPLDFL